MAFLAEDIPQHHWITMWRPVIHTDFCKPCEQLFRLDASLCNAGEIALNIRHKYRHTNFGKRFGQLLQCDSFTRTRSAGYQPMTVRHTGQQMQFLFGGSGNQERRNHDEFPVATFP
ncbi:hypothetical protein D3C75_899750 [compost metagenome]